MTTWRKICGKSGTTSNSWRLKSSCRNPRFPQFHFPHSTLNTKHCRRPEQPHPLPGPLLLPSRFQRKSIFTLSPEEDPDYGTGREYVVCASVEEGEYEEAEAAFDEHHTDPFAISDVVERAEVERIVMEYMQEN